MVTHRPTWEAMRTKRSTNVCRPWWCPVCESWEWPSRPCLTVTFPSPKPNSSPGGTAASMAAGGEGKEPGHPKARGQCSALGTDATWGTAQRLHRAGRNATQAPAASPPTFLFFLFWIVCHTRSDRKWGGRVFSSGRLSRGVPPQRWAPPHGPPWHRPPRTPRASP